jgi:hypothetical protein
MSDESRRDAAEDQGQMKDQEAFGEDPRGSKEESEQSGETQPSGSGDDSPPAADEDDRQGETGRDDPGHASGNPANAG